VCARIAIYIEQANAAAESEVVDRCLATSNALTAAARQDEEALIVT